MALKIVPEDAPIAGIRAVFYGGEGIGKTTTACSAPSPLLVRIEDGATSVDRKKVMMTEIHREAIDVIETTKDLVKCYDAEKKQLIVNGRVIKTIVYDSVTALERKVHAAIIRTDQYWQPNNPKNVTMESAGNGYGSAYQVANEFFVDFLQRLEFFKNRGINIILIAHSLNSIERDTIAGSEYSMTNLALHSPNNGKANGKRETVREWADLIGYLHMPITVSKSKGNKMALASTSGSVTHAMAVNKSTRYVAKNRYHIDEIDLIEIKKSAGWNCLAKVILDCDGKDYTNPDYPMPAGLITSTDVEKEVNVDASFEESIEKTETYVEEIIED
jgi:hypothetical protein